LKADILAWIAASSRLESSMDYSYSNSRDGTMPGGALRDSSLINWRARRDCSRLRRSSLRDRRRFAAASNPACGQVVAVGVREVADHIWLISFMHYDLGFFDDQCNRVECATNPFSDKVSAMSPV
jgi:hypothetical protein